MLRLSSYLRLPSRPERKSLLTPASMRRCRRLGRRAGACSPARHRRRKRRHRAGPRTGYRSAAGRRDDRRAEEENREGKNRWKKAPAVAAPATPVQSAGAAGGAAGEGGTKPGLNLDVPASTGSRLGMTPLETPASVEIIPGETIQERRQTDVNAGRHAERDRLHVDRIAGQRRHRPIGARLHRPQLGDAALRRHAPLRRFRHGHLPLRHLVRRAHRGAARSGIRTVRRRCHRRRHQCGAQKADGLFHG